MVTERFPKNAEPNSTEYVTRETTVHSVAETGGSHQRAVGVFQRPEDLQNAIHALKDAGFNMEHVSLIARNPEEVKDAQRMTGNEGNEAREGAAAGATAGTVLGGLGGLLVGLGELLVPGAGPFLAAGTLATTFAGAGIGAAAGGIVGGLVGLGIPEERAKVYNDRIKAGDYLVMVTGTEEEILRAQRILNNNSVEEFGIYNDSRRDVQQEVL